MQANVYSVTDIEAYRKAGQPDLIRLLAVQGGNAIFIPKWQIEVLVWGIVNHKTIHLSGPTGCAKSSVLEALYFRPENFKAICQAMGLKHRELIVYPIEMATFEAPGELYERRALKNGCTYNEKSILVEALETSAKNKNKTYSMIWLREMGRVHSAAVQGGLLNLMTKGGEIVLPDGTRIDGSQIAWVADSNYQAEDNATYTLVPLDDALKRRFSLNLTLDYLTPDQEIAVLRHVISNQGESDEVADGQNELIAKAVSLGLRIREMRAAGKLNSVAAPTIFGYLTFVQMGTDLAHLHNAQIAEATMLGNVSVEDRDEAATILRDVFNLQQSGSDDHKSNAI